MARVRRVARVAALIASARECLGCDSLDAELARYLPAFGAAGIEIALCPACRCHIGFDRRFRELIELRALIGPESRA